MYDFAIDLIKFLGSNRRGKTAGDWSVVAGQAILFGDEFEKTTDGQVSICP